ncbi:MAG: FtsW/RodA/SpoVE family cell cycle protein, partial [Candidatus Pacebacteria bacterium]|nr:FtsW/RodA/SpoVE family cell cycle protein [Candidatus Paceibacterota bacterium]
MIRTIAQFFSEHLRAPKIDKVLFFAILPLLGAGLITMNSFVGESNYFFEKQTIWIIISLLVFFIVSSLDLGFLKQTSVLVVLFASVCGILTLLLFLGTATQGAVSWIHFSG